VDLSAHAVNRVYGGSGAATLTNVDNTISGAGALGGGQMTLINQAAGVINANKSVALTIDTGAATIVNAGLIEATGAGGLNIQSAVNNTGTLGVDVGALTVNGAVSGTGGATIKGGTLDFASGFTQNVIFKGGAGVLELAQSQSYTGKVTGFSLTGGTSLDLRDVGFVSAGEATFSGTTSSGVLTVSDGIHTAHITLIGNYTGSAFVASSDGKGGTIVVDPPAAAQVPSTHRFVAAMAGLGVTVGEAIHTDEPRSAHAPVLARPQTMIA
jgi:hypothetical protein